MSLFPRVSADRLPGVVADPIEEKPWLKGKVLCPKHVIGFEVQGKGASSPRPCAVCGELASEVTNGLFHPRILTPPQRPREAPAPSEAALIPLERQCQAQLECGGFCRLEKGHPPPCSCPGDINGPGSCPA